MTNKPKHKGFAITLDIGLCMVFLTLKVANFIAWSWWWIFSPIWISFLLYAGITYIEKLLDKKTNM